jgi:hypothetical protein
MKFPVVIRHRGENAKIYGQTPAYPFYRLAYKAAGKRHVRSFKTYSEARQEGENVVRDLAKGECVNFWASTQRMPDETQATAGICELYNPSRLVTHGYFIWEWVRKTREGLRDKWCNSPPRRNRWHRRGCRRKPLFCAGHERDKPGTASCRVEREHA